MFNFQNSGGPPVVQGQVVNANVYSHSGAQDYNYNKTAEYGGEATEVTKGEHQPRRCNDPFWAFLFYAQLVTMGFLAATNLPKMADIVMENVDEDRMLMEGGSMFTVASRVVNAGVRMFSVVGKNAIGRNLEENEEEAETEVTPEAITFIIGTSSVCGFIFSGLSLTFMMAFAEGLIKFGLWFNIITGLLMGVAGLMIGEAMTAGMGFLFFALAAWYAYAVWNRIPFAAANLVTAVTAVRANIGVSLFAYVSIFFMIGWMFLWSLSAVSTMFVLGDCDAEGQCQNEINGVIAFLLLLSLYWTFEVIKNVVHTTVAGTVGTWWWNPHEANSCCSSGVRDSYVRSITYSFGSICFGSLLVAIIKALREMLHKARESDDGLLLCVADCLLGCLESIIEYFNEWAFVYVGLYGYTFMDAAKNVITLFKSRGWTTIITDSMIGNVLAMISVGVGLVTGLIGAAIANSQGSGLNTTGFIIGFLMGFMLNSVLMGVVGSAVNTIIVCYAEDPNTFQANHPELSNRMRDAWRQAWPAEFKY